MSNINKITPKTISNDEPNYDARLVSTTTVYDKTKYEELGLVSGSATQGISLTKTFFSGLRSLVGSRVTNVENLFTRGFDFAIEHMFKNASIAHPNWKKIVGLWFSMTALNPEAISVIVTGTAIGLKQRGGVRKKGHTKKRGKRGKRKSIRL
jgi:uncharacterized protein YbjQ (UPF0145 family)